jgi:hypothetical protein
MDEKELAELRTLMLLSLQVSYQYAERVDPADTERIAAIRDLGRRIGREQKRKIVTYASAKDGSRTFVIVAYTELTDEEERHAKERMSEALGDRWDSK